MSKEEIANKLFELGVSLDYDKPAELSQLKRMNEDKLRLCYNSIKWTSNLVDITRVKGTQIGVTERESFTYILTFSFPCQNLSLAGKRANLKSNNEIDENNIYDFENRSNMLWQVIRILKECQECNDGLPQILLMENVTTLHSKENKNVFKELQLILEEMGYQNYWEDMSAVDFGIPQTRNRTFMVSILGNYNYKFPKKTKLELRLKDLLEKNVDEKYFLSDKMIKYIASPNEKWTGNNNGAFINKSIASTINTGEGSKRCDASNYICDDLPEDYDLSKTLNFNLQIRKLIPLEAFRLMGLKDEDVDLIMQNQIDSSGRHLAGDSIVTTCLMAIFSQLLDIDYKEKFKPEEWWKNDK